MKILIAGANGLIGSALKKELLDNKRNYSETIFITRNEADLTKEEQVHKIFKQYNPDYVINAAASVGGILGNCNNHAHYYLNNTLINTFIIDYSYKFGVKKLLNMSSTCIFPKEYEEFNETKMHLGEPFEAHFAYAYSKRMIDIQCKAYESQYKQKNYSCIIPGNVFGPNDRFNIISGHVIPCLLLKVFLAKKENKPLLIWGDGTPKREFIYSFDLAKIMLDILELNEIPRNILVSSDTELTIKELVSVIVEEVGFQNEIIWDSEKPNGQMRKRSDTTLLKSLFPNISFTDFRVAIKNTFEWIEKNYPNIRMD
jgi:GDP-L-fucose synthase